MNQTVRITEAEWEVMMVVWDQAPVAASTIVQVLADRKQWTLTTVRTLLRRLVNKGALTQEFDDKRYLYRPRISKEACVKHESESFLDRVLGRAPGATLVHLVTKADLTREDIQELRRALRQKEREI
jgi:BlaI family transcriptional regulator, penicillinase repressor